MNVQYLRSSSRLNGMRCSEVYRQRFPFIRSTISKTHFFFGAGRWCSGVCPVLPHNHTKHWNESAFAIKLKKQPTKKGKGNGQKWRRGKIHVQRPKVNRETVVGPLWCGRVFIRFYDNLIVAWKLLILPEWHEVGQRWVLHTVQYYPESIYLGDFEHCLFANRHQKCSELNYNFSV